VTHPALPDEAELGDDGEAPALPELPPVLLEPVVPVEPRGLAVDDEWLADFPWLAFVPVADGVDGILAVAAARGVADAAAGLPMGACCPSPAAGFTVPHPASAASTSAPNAIDDQWRR